ncbi:MAG: NADPH-dependent glutamate synthase [Oscillospiraceae bacterium]
MPNMNPKKLPMPEQDPNVRNHNFLEVTTGYTAEMAIEEAGRCLHCKNKPCVEGCPVNIRIPEFIDQVAAGEFLKAYEIIADTNALPAVSGRVCPQENQCEALCVRAIKGEPVAIGRLERFVADWYRANVREKRQLPELTGKKVAVVGSGPAGLACAGDLAKLGYRVTIFEAFHTPGGVLVYGIPEFRLPKSIVQNEVDKLLEMGVELQTNVVVGRTISVDEMIESGFEAVFIGSGAGLPMFMGIPGEALAGVYSANEYLTRVNLMKAYKEGYDTPVLKCNSVAVVGGGNVAMDAARCAKRMGAEHVYILYRRGEEEMPARQEESHHAREEGIEFMLLTNPLQILDDGHGRVGGVECIKMRLQAPDESGRRVPKAVEGSNFVLDIDALIMSLGTNPNPLIRSTTPGLEANRKGCLIVNEDTMETSRQGVYAGGDAVTGAATVILAMGAGKIAAEHIDLYLKQK